MSEYGTVNITRDQEANTTPSEPATRWQKCRRTLGLHGHRIFIAWFTVIAITAVLTLSFHFSLLPSHHPIDDSNVGDQCVSDRSWFVALMLSIFLGPFGKKNLRNHGFCCVLLSLKFFPFQRCRPILPWLHFPRNSEVHHGWSWRYLVDH